jgi:single-strand DNA-binding protein
MANLNKVMLIGRLTRDPEVRTFANGGKVAKFGFAVNFTAPKKNPTTGLREAEAVFIDVEVFNREFRQLADLVEQYLRKGNQVYLEGRLRFNQWTDKDNQKRSKLLVVADTVEFLEPKAEGANVEEGSRGSRPPSELRKPAASAPADDGYDEPMHGAPAPEGHGDEEIPF